MASFGVFVELVDIFVEGLVHVTALQNDYYRFDHGRHRLVGERTGVRYRLGDSVRVKVVAVNLDERKIDFEIAGQSAGKKTGEKTGKKKGRKKKDGKKRGNSDRAKDGKPADKRAGKKTRPGKKRGAKKGKYATHKGKAR